MELNKLSLQAFARLRKQKNFRLQAPTHAVIHNTETQAKTFPILETRDHEWTFSEGVSLASN